MRGGVKMGFSFLRRIGNLSGPVYASGDILFAAADKKYVAGGKTSRFPRQSPTEHSTPRRKKNDAHPKVPPDKKTSWGKRETV